MSVTLGEIYQRYKTVVVLHVTGAVICHPNPRTTQGAPKM